MIQPAAAGGGCLVVDQTERCMAYAAAGKVRRGHCVSCLVTFYRRKYEQHLRATEVLWRGRGASAPELTLVVR